jgi:hypothetical protein
MYLYRVLKLYVFFTTLYRYINLYNPIQIHKALQAIQLHTVLQAIQLHTVLQPYTNT